MPDPSAPFPPLADYGLIGDTCSAALVNRVGGIDWLCWPRFDSGAIFCALLDRDRGGRCELVAAAGTTLVPIARRYRPRTLVLETTVAQVDPGGAERGRLTIVDAMPVRPAGCGDTDQPRTAAEDVDLVADGRLIREVRCDAGRVDVELLVWPTFDFAAARPARCERAADDGQRRLTFRAPPGPPPPVNAEGQEDSGGGAGDDHARECHVVALDASGPLTFDADRGAASLPLSMRAGDVAWIALAQRVDDAGVTAPAASRMLATTTRYWEGWSSRTKYDGPLPAAIDRSLLTLKAMTYSPTGAIVAAPTLGLPEVIGGVRNYDYRFSWVRDSGFTIRALLACGHRREARAYLRYLGRAEIDEGKAMPVLLTLDGKRPGDKERTLAHLRGYRGSGPIIAGNRAATQQQHDVWGEALNALHVYREMTGELPPDGDARREHIATIVRNLANCVAEDWRKPDAGIWERRDRPRHFVHSKALCWVALDRAAKLAPALGLEADAARWRALAEVVRSEYIARAWNPALNAYAAWYDPDGDRACDAPLDAAVLRAGLLGAFDFSDVRFRATIEAIRDRLSAADVGAPELIYRYRDADGIVGDEGAFTSCAFWVVTCLALIGRRAESDALRDRLLARGNDLGLFAEEIDPRTGAQLGNVPQAFTHMAIVNGAARLQAADGHER